MEYGRSCFFHLQRYGNFKNRWKTCVWNTVDPVFFHLQCYGNFKNRWKTCVWYGRSCFFHLQCYAFEVYFCLFTTTKNILKYESRYRNFGRKDPTSFNLISVVLEFSILTSLHFGQESLLQAEMIIRVR